MQPQHFDPVHTRLYKGVNLIEASAGTGKTYAIAMLALRFVVEENIGLEKLLVVTFTKAATEELKDRIRARLAEAQRALVGNDTGVDNKIVDWLKNLALTPQQIKQRLDIALLNIDQASIFTIHGFCQRVLQERPLESGQLFSSELIDDVSPIKQQCADDFWRRHIYPRTVWEAAVLTASYKTPDELLASVDHIAPHICVYPAPQNLDTALADLKRYADLASDALPNAVTILQNCFSDDKFKASAIEHFDSHASELSAWLRGDSTQLPGKEAFALLTGQGLKEALNGHKFRTTKTQSGDDRKMDYLASLDINAEPFDKLATAINEVTLILRRILLEHLRVDIDKQLQQQNVMSFDELITRLADALRGDKSTLLISQLRQNFSVALIDEFQDTDDSQWCIFSRIFAAPTQYLYLIGDPKQAIYKFRGADIYSYLGAQKTAEHRFTLASNWRSHPQLVEAVNGLFQRQNAFFLEDLQFTAVKPGLSAQQGSLYHADQVIAPMMLWQLPPSETSKGHWGAGAAGLAIRSAVVVEIINLLTQAYSLQPSSHRIQPKDIAILVRSNRQAREYQAALRTANVPSVLNSMESVFSTPEAIDLYTVLSAIAQPGNTALFKQAMTLNWFGFDGQGFYRFINDEAAMDAGMERVFAYHQAWQKSGLMAMMQQVLAQEKIKANLSTTNLSERQLTNIQHLLELVQQMAVDRHLSINKTVDWLHTAITQASGSEDQQLRLESDENAVRIVTTHRSKGLEYNIVFCPYLWQRSSYENPLVICHENGQMVADLGSDDFAQRRLQALDEELAEDLRVFYVAVTRAKYRCYLAWADVRTATTANNSAMAWLMEFADADFAEQQTRLQGFKAGFATIFDYQLLELSEFAADRYQKPIEILDLQAKKRSRSLYTAWQMSSYTALSALTVQETPEFPEDKANEQQLRSDAVQTLLPRGTQTGNVVHELLETNSFSHLAKHPDISVQQHRLCLRYGLKLEQPQLLDELLYAVVTTPLSITDTEFCLMNLQDQHCLKEMPFYLSLTHINTVGINGILRDSPTFQPLESKQIAGYLTGFIDLICEYQGRYYVMDYKTNTLPDYRDETLVQAMREHNYGLQYWLYSVVLHRYLQLRLPNYDYQQHFGGVRYLFVRGMQPDVAMAGVYEDRPELDKINALAMLFDA
ncbi:Exodeoxyribonuclease V, beta subunit [Crenothrix polyspora]|uniref:RecBCD enzyme subunit RecB n=1 Tax=Crenothrix polyspora TaxID=360316 RepID=A0A1R4H112_9GAMM|nr:exodeoxyribonuclease V subunit beta [Crenothrix polyspora]SJM89740.1 Exodeoxyribonuclease V, beta subunit [Crenothrix polyspora]